MCKPSASISSRTSFVPGAISARLGSTRRLPTFRTCLSRSTGAPTSSIQTCRPRGSITSGILPRSSAARRPSTALTTTLRELGNADGIAFDFDAVKISPNTLDAHRLVRWAATNGEQAQSAVVGLLFKANFEEGRNVGDHAVLLDIAEQAGLDRPVIAALLGSDADKDAVKEEVGMAREMGVTGVPCFILEGQYAVMGAQSVDVLTNAVREIAEMKASGG